MPKASIYQPGRNGNITRGITASIVHHCYRFIPMEQQPVPNTLITQVQTNKTDFIPSSEGC